MGCLLIYHHHTTTVLRPFFRDHPGEPVPEQNMDFIVQGKINKGRHTDHLAGCHSIWLNSATSTIPPTFAGWMPFLPPNQQCQSTEGNQSTVTARANLIQIRCLQTNHVHTIPTRDRQMDRPKACNSITLSYYEAEQLTKMTKKQPCEVHKFINGISKIHTVLWNTLSGQNFHKTGDDRVFHVMWLCLPCDLSGCPVSDPVCY